MTYLSESHDSHLNKPKSIISFIISVNSMLEIASFIFEHIYGRLSLRFIVNTVRTSTRHAYPICIIDLRSGYNFNPFVTKFQYFYIRRYRRCSFVRSTLCALTDRVFPLKSICFRVNRTKHFYYAQIQRNIHRHDA